MNNIVVLTWNDDFLQWSVAHTFPSISMNEAKERLRELLEEDYQWVVKQDINQLIIVDTETLLVNRVHVEAVGKVLLS